MDGYYVDKWLDGTLIDRFTHTTHLRMHARAVIGPPLMASRVEQDTAAR